MANSMLPLRKIPSTGDMFSMRKIPSTGELLLTDMRASSVVAKASPIIITSTATLLSAASSIVSSTNVLSSPHPEAATVVSAVASLLGGTASLLAASIERQEAEPQELEQEVEASMITCKDGKWLHVDSDASLEQWKEAGVCSPARTTVITSQTSDEMGIVFINGVPLSEYLQHSDIKRLDLIIK